MAIPIPSVTCYSVLTFMDTEETHSYQTLWTERVHLAKVWDVVIRCIGFTSVDSVGSLQLCHQSKLSWYWTEDEQDQNQDWAFCIWLYSSLDTLQPNQTGEPSLPKTW